MTKQARLHSTALECPAILVQDQVGTPKDLRAVRERLPFEIDE
jgi:hypothetical protein